MKRILILALAWGLGACGGPRRAPESGSTPPAVEVVELGTLRDVSLCDGIWFGAAPAPEDLDLARRRGVRRVLAIDAAGPEGLEALCAELDLEFRRFLLHGAGIDDDEARAVVDALQRGEGNGDTFLFSDDGSMAAALFAAHRVIHGGVPLERALVEARRAGMRPGEGEDLVRRLASAPSPQPTSSLPR